MRIAIATIAYNRIDSIKRLLTSLTNAYYNNENVTLIISIDKSDTDIVEKYADSFVWQHGEKRVIKHSKNLGLRKHVLSIGGYLEEYDAVIVLEDDLIVSPNFYLFAKSAVEHYYNNDSIAGISLYSFAVNYQNHQPFYPLKNEYDVFFMNCAQSWGQVWMRAQWHNFKKWYERHNDEFEYSPNLPKTICNWPKSSWLKYHTRYCIEENKYFVYPYQSYTSNCGDAGTHASFSNVTYQTCFNYGKWLPLKLPNLEEGVQYDGFFENKNLPQIIGFNVDNICIDLYGEKKKLNNRYLLTTKKYDYLIIRSFGLIYKPIELNVIYNSIGTDIFLYDTSAICKNIIKNSNRKLFNYYHGWDIIEYMRFISSYGIFNCLNLLNSLCIKKIKKKFNR